MNSKDIIIVSFCNVVKIAVFAALAVIFNRWWIVLFSLLFMSSLATVFRHCRVCDKCGKRSEGAESVTEAIKKAEQAGWLHIEDGNKDYCPECRNTYI